ncbi:RcpC/CpaB family pilus assembly protein [Nonomuraea jabiensis]|uniref:Flp pilus assembly protein CpaB n=1 Tax=Nonomuraea jabiensis TaxID=882448 RepID=A0A7W9G0J3_9ACTN|nr:RcpC/CpaB family pilus assembly protein [Nonomuraea jabiensis]MBB5774960.1 Flp pilus assembly protein CpaB [Nonomuraea jabiensis]
MIRAWLIRYGRRRRLVAAALAALAVMSGFIATRPEPAPTVLVAARDLSPGLLGPGDLTPAALNHPPTGAVRAAAAGQILASPMRKGEPLTDVRLLHSYRLPPGMVATPVRIADAATASLLTPGATITVLAAGEETHPARAVAEDVRIITIPRTPKTTSETHGALIVLATTPTQAAELASAQTTGHLSITIKSDAT